MSRNDQDSTTPLPLDRIDEEIIRILRQQGRITYGRLAALVHLTPRPCQERVRKLERHGIIRGYGAVIDERKVASGLSLLVLVALSNQYSVRMRCRDMEHYRALTETWLNDESLHIDKLVAHPELTTIKESLG